MKRNAVIAAGNVLAKREVPALRERLEALAADQSESELVSETARVVLRRLDDPQRRPPSGAPDATAAR
jgi:hypothetical protein